MPAASAEMVTKMVLQKLFDHNGLLHNYNSSFCNNGIALICGYYICEKFSGK